MTTSTNKPLLAFVIIGNLLFVLLFDDLPELVLTIFAVILFISTAVIVFNGVRSFFTELSPRKNDNEARNSDSDSINQNK